MKVDSTELAQCAFQSCRHLKPDSGAFVKALLVVLEAAHRQHTLVVEVPSEVAALVPAMPALGATWPHGPALTPAHDKILALVEAGAADLARLIAMETIDTVQSLGYALHVLPPLLRVPEEFSSEQYVFCLRIAAEHWLDLCPPTRAAFCAIVGQDLADPILQGRYRTLPRKGQAR